METIFDELLAQGIRLQVKSCRLQGPYVAVVSCGVTGQYLGGVEKCQSADRAIEAGKKFARKKMY